MPGAEGSESGYLLLNGRDPRFRKFTGLAAGNRIRNARERVARTADRPVSDIKGGRENKRLREIRLRARRKPALRTPVGSVALGVSASNAHSFQVDDGHLCGLTLQAPRQAATDDGAFVSVFHRTARALSATAESRKCPPLIFGLGRSLKRLNMHKTHVSLAQIAAGFAAHISVSHRIVHGLSTTVESRTCPPRLRLRPRASDCLLRQAKEAARLTFALLMLAFTESGHVTPQRVSSYNSLPINHRLISEVPALAFGLGRR